VLQLAVYCGLKRFYLIPAWVVITLAGCGSSQPEQLHIHLEAPRLPADGFSTSDVSVRSGDGKVVPATLSVVEGHRVIRLEDGRVRTTINPGRAVIEARHEGDRPARATLLTEPSYTDRAGDGTPDFLRLDDPVDREAFANSFTYLAEAQFFRGRETPLSEVTDCSALLRYAYRQSLSDARFEQAPAQPDKYRYPFTPLGPRLFRTRAGTFRKTDLQDDTFAEFADAEALRRWNTHFISRDITRARRGDLLFYRQPDQRSPAHAMIFIGESHFSPDRERLVVYHTGPFGREKGEIRRPALRDLVEHQQAQWRPLAGNSNFLGVYRWNILRQDQ
jgi:uncharacterized protein YfaT (DUF1175 family)